MKAVSQGLRKIVMADLIFASWNFTHAASLSDGINQFLSSRVLIIPWISAHWHSFAEFLSHSHVFKPLIAWVITFLIVYIALSCLGFQTQGVVAGSLAAAFQAWAYGGFTPAAGLFATFTSIGMMSVAMPIFALAACVVATIVALLVWLAVR